MEKIRNDYRIILHFSTQKSMKLFSTHISKDSKRESRRGNRKVVLHITQGPSGFLTKRVRGRRHASVTTRADHCSLNAE